MDAAGEALWKATLDRAGEHDKAVVQAHDTVNEPEVAAYWIDWNGFKASLKDLNDRISSTFSVVLDSDIQVKDAQLNTMIEQFNDLAPRIQSRKLAIDEDLLLSAIAKQKSGEHLSDAEISAIAKYTAEGEKPLIKDSPVKPSIPNRPEYPQAPTPLWDTIPWYVKVGGAVLGVAFVANAFRR